MDLLRRQGPAGQQRHHSTPFERAVRHVGRQRRDAHAAARGREQGREVVGAQRPGHRHRERRTRAITQVPACIALCSAVDERVVPCQVGRLDRSAALRQVSRRGHQHPGVEPQVARAQRGIGQAPHADGDVDALLHQVHVAVLEDQLDLQARILAHEAHDQRHQHAPPEGHRGADAQPALHLGLQQRGHGLGLFDMVGDELALGVVQAADLGGRHATRAAVQQARAQLLFELGHELGGRGLAHAHLGGSLAERAQVDHANEQFDSEKAIHGNDYQQRPAADCIPKGNNANALDAGSGPWPMRGASSPSVFKPLDRRPRWQQ